MSNTEILIHDPDDLRPGDVLRVWPKEHPERWAEGPIWQGSGGGWHVGNRCVRRDDGDWTEGITFDLAKHPARRPVPPVDLAQVVALADLLEEAGDYYGRAVHEDIARRLLETGRVEVKP